MFVKTPINYVKLKLRLPLYCNKCTFACKNGILLKG